MFYFMELLDSEHAKTVVALVTIAAWAADVFVAHFRFRLLTGIFASCNDFRCKNKNAIENRRSNQDPE